MSLLLFSFIRLISDKCMFRLILAAPSYISPAFLLYQGNIRFEDISVPVTNIFQKQGHQASSFPPDTSHKYMNNFQPIP